MLYIYVHVMAWIWMVLLRFADKYQNIWVHYHIFTHADDKDKENVNKVCQDHNLIFNLGERRQES